MANLPDVLLDVRHLSQYFGKQQFRAVDDISFTIRRGEIFGLVGESGSGKTTTGRAIIKLHSITDGDIYFKGERIAAGTRTLETRLRVAHRTHDAHMRATLKKQIARARYDTQNCEKNYRAHTGSREPLMTKIQMIFQDPIASLDPRMTVREIIAEGLRIRGEKNGHIITEKVNTLLTTVGLLPEHAGRYPHEFSGGQRQRIGIARVLMVQPELIIADEPVSALDVSIRAHIINLLHDIRTRYGLTMLFIAHDLSLVKYFCDRIAVMHRGKIVELAPADELFSHPLHPYTQALLSAIPLPYPMRGIRQTRRTYTPPDTHRPTEMCEVTGEHFVLCEADGAHSGDERAPSS
ncbi:MAG: ABC transporter ATP-binding protein [Treponema sp.]|nr:ABC transporter ATP-binding protein [Treponema sp.]